MFYIYFHLSGLSSQVFSRFFFTFRLFLTFISYLLVLMWHGGHGINEEWHGIMSDSITKKAEGLPQSHWSGKVDHTYTFYEGYFFLINKPFGPDFAP